MENITPFISVPEAARLTGLSKWYIRQLVKHDHVKYIKSGNGPRPTVMVKVASLEKLLDISLT